MPHQAARACRVPQTVEAAARSYVTRHELRGSWFYSNLLKVISFSMVQYELEIRFLDTQTTCNDQSIQPATPCTVTPPPHPGPLLSSSLFSCTHSPAMKTLYYYVVVPRASCSRAVPAVRGCRGARLSSGRGSGGRPRRAGRGRPRRRPRCPRRRAASCPAGERGGKRVGT